ncbi:glycoside hydrolase family 97 protein [Rapidithrix thailandica]|uniref:Glycoside hydrolase family 97 protein n=1 Tax=Rapidithrix thailandica TaxID=413964 RepID=A0AAW9S7Z6_9BACT
MRKLFAVLLACVVITGACSTPEKKNIYEVGSPGNLVKVNVFLQEEGQPAYQIMFKDKVVVDTSALGFVLAGGPSFDKKLEVINSTTRSLDETWEQPWGEEREIRNQYNELTVSFQEKEGQNRKFDVVFRVYDYGTGFRYVFPEQENLKEIQVTDELTEFKMTGNHQAWWTPAYKGNRYEYLYQKDPINALDTVHTPLTMQTSEGLYLSIHEAALQNYSSMTLASDKNQTLTCDLVPWNTGVKAKMQAPSATPWRTLQIAEKPGDLITSYLILNLNEPNKIGEVSWVKPGKYIGIWWEMHINTGTWNSGPKHAATTKNTKKYIDFASKYGFDGVLVEGWNIGWDGDWMQDGSNFRFAEPYPDYNIDELCSYAKDKGVYIIGHHETGADVLNYESQLEEAYAFLEKHGMKAVKTGYVEMVGKLNNNEWHHGQFMVEHFKNVADMAAKHKVAVVAHEPIKQTGLRRTYPNMVSAEGARGQEYNAWSGDGGNPPSHTAILPFTRLLGGPMDFTPGVFDIQLPTQPNNQINTTLAKQLALYVVLYAPMQMACDLPENYEGHPAFQFILDVATDWETTKVLDAEIGEYVAIARQERGGERWFVGAITNENPRNMNIKLDFLESGKKYKATLYADGEDAHYLDNPTAYKIEEMEVTSGSELPLKLAASGGVAISIVPM